MNNYNSSKSKGAPMVWRGLQRRLPSTLSTFQITVLVGFVSLLVLKSTIGIGSFTSVNDDAMTDHFVSDSEGDSILDVDNEPKRNLAQVKSIGVEDEKLHLVIDKDDEFESEDLHTIEEVVQETVENDKENVDQVVDRIDEIEGEDGGKVIEDVAGKKGKHKSRKSKPEKPEDKKKVEEPVSVETQVEQTSESLDNFKALEAELAQGESTELKAEVEENDGEELESAQNREDKTPPEETEHKVEESSELEETSPEERKVDEEQVTEGSNSEEKTLTPEEIQELHRQAIENMTRVITRNASEQFSLGPRVGDWDQQRAAWLENNPHMKTTDPHKPKVILITGSQPFPCKSPVGDHYLLKMLKNKVDYARIHRLETFYNFAHLDKPMSHYWAKLPLIRKMMLMHPEAEWIFWMDSDALFTDMVFEIPFEKYDDYNLVMWGYDSGIYEERSWVACNTGVFFMRNNQWTLDLLDEWALMGPEGDIRTEAGKILTSYLKRRPEMMADDQSALVFLMLTREELRPRIHLEWEYWLSGYWADIVDRYEEFSAKSHPGAGGDQWPFTTHFTGCQPCSGVFNPMYEGNSCLDGMERAFNFADNQVLRSLGFEHESLKGAPVKRIRNETAQPLISVPVDNTWAVGSFY